MSDLDAIQALCDAHRFDSSPAELVAAHCSELLARVREAEAERDAARAELLAGVQLITSVYGSKASFAEHAKDWVAAARALLAHQEPAP